MTWLAATAIAGHGVGYLLSVLLARRLGVAGFEAYAVASAAFILLAAFAPLGAERYVLRRLPALLGRADWNAAAGLLWFGARRTLVTALVTGSVLAGWTWWTRDPAGETWRAVLVTCLSLPAGALAHYGVDALTAAGRPLQALAAFKLLTPALALVLALILTALPTPLSGAAAVACWGVAWVATLAVLVVALRRAVPAAVFVAVPVRDDRPAWRAESRPFLVYRLSLALLAQSGVIALELLQPSAAAVGAYAAAAATAGIAAVLAASTNRAYGRELSLLLERGDFDGVLAARRTRLRWLAPIAIATLAAMIVLAPGILALFRPEFAAEGAPALRLLAVATGVSVLFALAPTYLKFQQRNRVIYTAVAVAAVVQCVLLVLLVPALGATGAALAHALCIAGLYGALAVLAHREVVGLRRSGGD